MNNNFVCGRQQLRSYRFHTLLSSSVSHYSFLHLLANCYVLNNFGPDVIILVYFICFILFLYFYFSHSHYYSYNYPYYYSPYYYFIFLGPSRIWPNRFLEPFHRRSYLCISCQVFYCFVGHCWSLLVVGG